MGHRDADANQALTVAWVRQKLCLSSTLFAGMRYQEFLTVGKNSGGLPVPHRQGQRCTRNRIIVFVTDLDQDVLSKIDLAEIIDCPLATAYECPQSCIALLCIQGTLQKDHQGTKKERNSFTKPHGIGRQSSCRDDEHR